MIRHLLFAATLLTAAVPAASFAQAEASPARAAAPQRTPDQVANMYRNRLALLPEQEARLKPIIADRQQQMLALRADTSIRPREKAQRYKGIMEESDKRIKAILTPDQQTKYTALEAEQKQKMKELREAKAGDHL